MDKILITGASGFIGTNLLQFYIQNGFDVLNIDISPPKDIKYFKNWQKIDILDSVSLESAILSFQPNFVIHLAARTDLHGKSLKDYATNTIGTQNLIEIINKLPSVKRVIFTSSMLVCSLGYIPNHEIDYNPSTIYGESKVQMEVIIRNTTHNYEWLIVRPTSIWGPWFGTPYRNFFDMIINKRYFHIGNKSCTKTYGYVENLIYQINSILNASTEIIQGKVFYLGDYEPTNIHLWANEIASINGSKINMIPYPLINIVAIMGDVLKLVGVKFPMTTFRLKNMTTENIVDLANTQELAPNLPISRIEGIRRTLKWLKDNK